MKIKTSITYPKEYPCICKIVEEGGGLMGEYYEMHVAYFPKNVTIKDAFIMGINNPFKKL